MARKPSLPGAQDFFGGSPTEQTTRAKRRTVKPQHRNTAGKVPELDRPVQGGPARTVEAGLTEKVTFYISSELLKRLELTRVQLLLDQNLKVSRSQIVEAILVQGVGDVEAIASLLESAAEY